MTSSTEQEVNDNSNTESIGARLQRERRNQHKSLKDVAETTCIHIHTLKALEADDHEQLPAAVFVKGFIKLYAKFLDIDPEEALSHYAPPSKPTVIDNGESNFYQEIITAEEKREEESGVSFKKILLIIIVFMIILLLYAGSRIFVGEISEPDINSEQPNTISVEPLTTTEPSSSLSPTPASDDNTVDNALEETAGETMAEIIRTPTPEPNPPAHISELPTIDNNIHIAQPPQTSSNKLSTVQETEQNTREVPQRIQPTASTIVEVTPEIRIPAAEVEETISNTEAPTAEIAAYQPERLAVAEPIATPSATIESTITSFTPQSETLEAPKNDSEFSAPTSAKDFEQVLEAEFVEQTWLKVQIDNNRARQYTYQPGAIRIWKAHDKIKIHLGNAGGVRLTLNGTPLPTPGKSGRTARITIPDDYIN